MTERTGHSDQGTGFNQQDDAWEDIGTRDEMPLDEYNSIIIAELHIFDATRSGGREDSVSEDSNQWVRRYDQTEFYDYSTDHVVPLKVEEDNLYHESRKKAVNKPMAPVAGESYADVMTPEGFNTCEFCGKAHPSDKCWRQHIRCIICGSNRHMISGCNKFKKEKCRQKWRNSSNKSPSNEERTQRDWP